MKRTRGLPSFSLIPGDSSVSETGQKKRRTATCVKKEEADSGNFMVDARRPMKQKRSPCDAPVARHSLPINSKDSEDLRLIEKLREVDPNCESVWVPDVKKSDRSNMLRSESVRDNPENCIAVARAFQSPMDELIAAEITAEKACSDMMIMATENFNTQLTLVSVVQRLENELAQARKELDRLASRSLHDRKTADAAVTTLSRMQAQYERKVKDLEDRLDTERAAFSALLKELSSAQEKAKAERGRLYSKIDRLEEFFVRRSIVVGAEAYRRGYEMRERPESERVTPDQVDVGKKLAPGVYPEERWVDSEEEGEEMVGDTVSKPPSGVTGPSHPLGAPMSPPTAPNDDEEVAN